MENHWSLRWDLPVGATYLSSTLPHPACNLSVERGAGRAEVGDDPVVVTGVPTRRFDVTVRGRGWVHGVKFRPGGLAALSRGARRRPPQPHGARVRGAAGAHGRCAAGARPRRIPRRRAARSSTRPSPALARASPDPDYATLLDAGRRRCWPTVRSCGWRRSRPPAASATRSLQRLFARYVGVSPKWVLARYRMHDVVTALDGGYDGSLADLAAGHGWFDQAHFTREFTTLVGVPPGEYRRHV